MSKYTKEFEQLMCSLTGAKYAIATANCTCALEIIIRALGIEGKSVVVPTNTFLATALAVMHSGNRVVFADSRPQTLCLDPEDLKAKISDDTKAVILVHIGGIITPDYNEIKKICDDKGIFLIEDCAHAHGCSINNKQAGTLGIGGAFSFFPTKVLVTGEGGCITTNNEEVYKKSLMIRNHGKNPDLKNKMSEFGNNFRLSEITAAIGVQQLKNSNKIIKQRQDIAKQYDELLKDVEGIKPVKIDGLTESSYYKYIAYIDEKFDRNMLKSKMKQDYSVSLTGEVYSDLCHNEPIWDNYSYCGKQKKSGKINCNLWPSCGCDKKQDNFPGSEYISKNHICLPLYPGLSKQEIEYVVACLKKVIENEYAAK